MLKIFEDKPGLSSIFVNEVTILTAEDVSGKTMPFSGDQTRDIGVKLTLDIGRSFTPDFYVVGDFKRDPLSKEIIGWGQAMRVNNFFAKLGVKGNLTDDNRIPEEWIQSLPGKKFLRLSYLAGMRPNSDKPRYRDWTEVGTLEEGEDVLRAHFHEAVKNGWVRGYTPELSNDGGASPSEFPPVE